MIGKRICCLVLCGALLGGLSASAQASSSIRRRMGMTIPVGYWCEGVT